MLGRQIGLLHRRLGPSSARMTNAGPEIGEFAPKFDAVDVAGREVSLASDSGKQTLLVFISATCPACSELMPALRSVKHSEAKILEVVLVSLGGDDQMNRNFIARHKLEEIFYVASKDLGTQYGVVAPPYGVLIDGLGVVRSKGVINHLEHLESLLEAAQLNYPSMESWAQDRSVESTAVMLGSVPQ